MPGKMSSDIDEEEDYSSIDERDPKGEVRLQPPQQQQQQQLPQRSRHQHLQQQMQKQLLLQQQDQQDVQQQPAVAYVNLKDPNLTLDLNGEAITAGNGLRSATRRDKSRLVVSYVQEDLTLTLSLTWPPVFQTRAPSLRQEEPLPREAPSSGRRQSTRSLLSHQPRTAQLCGPNRPGAHQGEGAGAGEDTPEE